MQGAGISPGSGADNSLPAVGFTQGKLHETQLLLQAIRQSDGNPRRPHGTWQGAKLFRRKRSSSLPCRKGWDWGCTLRSPAHPAVTFPSPARHKSPSPPQQRGQGPHTPSPPRKGHPKAALQTLRHPKRSAGSAWVPGLPRHRRPPVPPRSSAIEHHPPPRHATPAAPVPKGSTLPQGPPRSFNPASQNHFIFFPHPQAPVSNSSDAKSHGAADFICIYPTASSPKAAIASIGSKDMKSTEKQMLLRRCPIPRSQAGFSDPKLPGREHQAPQGLQGPARVWGEEELVKPGASHRWEGDGGHQLHLTARRRIRSKRA